MLGILGSYTRAFNRRHGRVDEPGEAADTPFVRDANEAISKFETGKGNARHGA